MASRGHDIRRHYSSGSVKRKAKEEQLKKEQEVMSKIPKLTNFIMINCSDTPKPLSKPSTSSKDAVEISIKRNRISKPN